MYKILAKWSIVIPIVIFINACYSTYEFPCKISSEKVESKSQTITNKIYIDKTLSMQGFVNVSSSEYVRVLRRISHVAQNAWANSSSDYYGFGKKVEEKPFSNNNAKAAEKADFYPSNPPDYLQNALIQTAIPSLENNSKDHITIIVTDLYQERAEIEDVKTLLKNYLKQGYAVGILGIKSKFKGTIYDIGIVTEGQKPQKITCNQVCQHPFYVILLGKYNNIKNFYDALQLDLQGIQDKKFVVFNSQLVDKLLLDIRNNSNFSQAKNIKPRNSIQKGSVRIKIPGDSDWIQRLEIKGGQQGIQTIKHTPPYSKLLYTLDIEAWTKNFKLATYNTGGESDISNQFFSLKLPKISDVQAEEGKLELEANLETNKMYNGIYSITVNLIPQKLKTEPWWESWSFNESQIPGIISKKDATKTYNLLPFLSDLKMITEQQLKPAGHFCYVIEK